MSRKTNKRRTPPRAMRTAWPGAEPLTLPSWQQAWLPMLGVFILILMVYGMTSPATIALEDDGDFVFAVHSFGLAHPPGYPLFVWLAKPFTWLPFGEIAWRVHMASATFGALTCSVLWWLTCALTNRRSAAWLASLGFGFSGAFWSQAIVAEIYTLNTLVFVGLLAMAVAWLHQPRRWLLWLGALIYGLGLANHWPLLVLATPALVLLLWPGWRMAIRELPKIIVALVIGCLPYLWMFLRSQTHPEYGFYGAMSNWDDFWFVVSRAGYSSVDQSATATLLDKLQFIGFLGREALTQFTPLGALLALVGLRAQWLRWGLLPALAMLFAFLSASLALVLLLNFDYDYLGRSLFRVYPLIPWMIMALWMGLGFAAMLDWFAERQPSPRPFVAPAAVAVIVAGTLIWHGSDNQRRDYDHARDYATTILNAAEPDAIIFVMGDVDAYTLRYYRYVLGMRPDVTLLAQNGIGLSDPRLFDPRQTTGKQQVEILTTFVRQAERPVYFLHGEPPELTGINHAAMQKAVVPKSKPQTIYSINDDILAMLDRMAANDESTDPWTIRHRLMMMNSYGSWLTYVTHLHPDDRYAERFRPVLDALSDSVYPVAMTRIGILMNRDYETNRELIRQLHQRAGELMDHRVNKANRAIWWNYAGQFHQEDGDFERAEQAYLTAWDAYQNPAGSTLRRLLTLYAQQGDCQAFNSWRPRYQPRQIPPSMQQLDRRMQRQCGA